jgi:hypothetical protein
METSSKPIDQVSYSELSDHPVWEFVPESEDHDETWVRPVRHLPVNSLAGCLVATRVRLANGSSELAILSNIDLDDTPQNEHFLSLSVIKTNRETFHLARYHDIDYVQSGPSALAEFLGLTIKDVFPIEYDISLVAAGAADSLRGVVRQEPSRRLSRSELIAMAVGK